MAMIVVSLPKSGTNLVSRCVEALDYVPIGAGIRDSYPAVYARLAEAKGDETSVRKREDVLGDSSTLIRACVGAYGFRTSVFVHGLEHKGTLRDSCGGREMPVIFNYRDPRAVITSLVNYLTNGAREAYTPLSGYSELAAILARLPTVPERLIFLMKHVPNYLGQVFRKNLWLLREPRVLSVSYEMLVGSQGRGSDADQLACIEKIASYLGVTAEIPRIAASLYAKASRTFRQGSVDGWREAFTPDVEREFRRIYADILESYGYQ